MIKYPEINKIYQHYKGGKYEVITLAKHSETEEVLVIYKSIHFGSYHARPLDSWSETVKNEVNQTMERFKLIK